MSVPVQGPDGNTYQFPDGTDKAKAIEYFKKKGIGVKGASTTTPTTSPYPWESTPQTPPSGAPSWLQNAGHQVAEAGKGAAAGIGGILSSAAHPLQAVIQMGEQAMVGSTPYGTPLYAPTGNKARDIQNEQQYTATQQRVANQEAQQMRDRPVYTTASILTPMALGEGISRGTAAVRNAAPGTLRSLTGTGPEATANLAENVHNANAAEVDRTAKATEKAVAKRADQVQEHAKAVQTIKDDAAAAQTSVDRRVALERGVEKLDTQFHGDLTSLRNDVRAQANERYTAINQALDPKEANTQFLPTALEGAAEKIKGSNTEPTILKDIEKRVMRADEPLTYRDLQGYYSELGREMQKGTLPGDVYQAYKSLHESIGGEMQNIANRNGLGPQLQQARQGWSNMMTTFYDPDSPIANAVKVGNSLKRSPGDVVGAFQDRNAAVQALAKYSPELAQRINTIRGYQAEASALPSKPKTIKSLPKLAPKEPSEVPNIQTIGPEEIRGAKSEALQNRADLIRKHGRRIVSYGLGVHSLWDAFNGNVAGIGRDIGVGAAGYGITEAFARALERPEVRNLLTNPTPEDIAQIPPDLRRNLRPMLEEAQKQGVKVSPLLLGATGGVGAAMRPAGQGNQQ